MRAPCKERQNQVAMLVLMGHQAEEAAAALEVVGGDPEAALKRLDGCTAIALL